MVTKTYLTNYTSTYVTVVMEVTVVTVVKVVTVATVVAVVTVVTVVLKLNLRCKKIVDEEEKICEKNKNSHKPFCDENLICDENFWEIFFLLLFLDKKNYELNFVLKNMCDTFLFDDTNLV